MITLIFKQRSIHWLFKRKCWIYRLWINSGGSFEYEHPLQSTFSSNFTHKKKNVSSQIRTQKKARTLKVTRTMYTLPCNKTNIKTTHIIFNEMKLFIEIPRLAAYISWLLRVGLTATCYCTLTNIMQHAHTAFFIFQPFFVERISSRWNNIEPIIVLPIQQFAINDILLYSLPC